MTGQEIIHRSGTVFAVKCGNKLVPLPGAAGDFVQFL